MKKVIVSFLGILILASCSKRNLTYFGDLPQQAVHIESIETIPSLKIKPDDVLRITVHSLNPEANTLFNRGFISAYGMANGVRENNTTSNLQSLGYLVDKEGYIDFPILGKIKIGGLTKDEGKAKLLEKLKEYLKDPTVNIRYLNYQVTVIGEVNRPSVLTIQSEKINILEALGMAGDMTPYGKRENVLIIREEEGERIMARINLNRKEVLNSPYFYLQQNDVVYVEATKARAIQASLARANLTIALSIASILAIILTRVL